MNARVETLDGWVDLAAECLGGRALHASDEFFAAKENLLRPGRGVFEPDRYTDRGKWMDGWESRRRRTPGHDWCIVRLGLPGTIRAVIVDTHHFRGNYPAAASLDGLEAPGIGVSVGELVNHAGWRPIAAKAALEGHHENRLAVAETGRLRSDRVTPSRVTPSRVTHVRLNIFPDGGVARLRVFGTVVPDWPQVLAAGRSAEPMIDLAALRHGGRPLACSDAFFSRPINLLMADDGVSMADGWETQRRRGPGHDWVVVQLGQRGTLSRALIDTRHFKGNFPDRCSLEGIDATALLPAPSSSEDLLADAPWRSLLPAVPLAADTVHGFDLADAEPVTHVRLNIMPDGGVSRLRLLGVPLAEEAAPQAGAPDEDGSA